MIVLSLKMGCSSSQLSLSSYCPRDLLDGERFVQNGRSNGGLLYQSGKTITVRDRYGVVRQRFDINSENRLIQWDGYFFIGVSHDQLRIYQNIDDQLFYVRDLKLPLLNSTSQFNVFDDYLIVEINPGELIIYRISSDQVIETVNIEGQLADFTGTHLVTVQPISQLTQLEINSLQLDDSSMKIQIIDCDCRIRNPIYRICGERLAIYGHTDRDYDVEVHDLSDGEVRRSPPGVKHHGIAVDSTANVIVVGSTIGRSIHW